MHLAAQNALVLPFASEGVCTLYNFDNLKRFLYDQQFIRMAQPSGDVHPVVVRVRRADRDLKVGIDIPEPFDRFQSVPSRRHAHVHKSHGVGSTRGECCLYSLEPGLALQGKIEIKAQPSFRRSSGAEHRTLGRLECGISMVRSGEDLAKILVNLRIVVDDKYARLGRGARAIQEASPDDRAVSLSWTRAALPRGFPASESCHSI